MKRALDLILAVALAPAIALLCVPLMVAIKIESPGPAIFAQQRLGRGQKTFRILKLRTMHRGTEDLPSHLVGRNRITKLGAWLRRYKLDELPQLINVLSGSMSFIGPRPCLPTQLELVRAREARGLFDYLPGITGPAQLSGLDMSDPDRLTEVEERYFSRATVWTDIGLILQTALGRGNGDAALEARLPRHPEQS